MNWDALGAIAELIGGLAVIATLAYLAIQIRQSNRQESAQAVKEAITEFVNAYGIATSDAATAKNFRDGLNRFQELDRNDQAMFHSRMQLIASGYYQVWTLYKKGMLEDEELFLQCRNLILTILRTPGAQAWWDAWKHLAPQSFINEVDKLVHDPESSVIPANEDLNWFKSDD